MKLENTFQIPVPAEDAWPVLLDLERLAPCVPGAVLTSRDGADFHGKIKVELGPVGLTYNGVVKVISQDAAAKVAVLEGGGRETRGNGTAKAVITCRLVESGGITEVFVDTDLAITGKPAQFGSGALADVAGSLIGTFAENLAAEITAAAPGGAVPDTPAETIGAAEKSVTVTRFDRRPAAEPHRSDGSRRDRRRATVGAGVGRGGRGTPALAHPAASLRSVTGRPIEPVRTPGATGTHSVYCCPCTNVHIWRDRLCRWHCSGRP